jgi:DNA-binding CsgD family transcriptional regulator
VVATDALPAMLDAAVELHALRRALLSTADRSGTPAGTTLVGVGETAVRRALLAEAARHDDVRGVHPTCSLAEVTFGQDRWFRNAGGRTTTVYNPSGTPDDLLPYLTDGIVPAANYFAPAPTRMLVFDRAVVVLDGVELGGEPSAIAVTDQAVLAAALRYWDLLLRTAVAVRDAVADDPFATLTPRQRAVVRLLAADSTDTVIAARLGVSVRTVQYEVAEVLRVLGARSRFGAGLALGRLSAADHPRVSLLGVGS